MKKRHAGALVAAAAYISATIFFMVNSGAGHGWGTGALFVASLPLGAVAFLFGWLAPNTGFALTFPLFGLIQYICIGYLIGRWMERNGNRPGQV